MCSALPWCPPCPETTLVWGGAAFLLMTTTLKESEMGVESFQSFKYTHTLSLSQNTLLGKLLVGFPELHFGGPQKQCEHLQHTSDYKLWCPIQPAGIDFSTGMILYIL